MTPPSTSKLKKSTDTNSSPLEHQSKRIPGPPTDTSLSPFEKVQLFLDAYKKFEGIDSVTTPGLRLVSVVVHPRGNPGPLCTCVFAITVTPPLCNRRGTLHGGAIAQLIDICTTIALAPIARSGFWEFAGVSRTLSVTYLRPAPAGMEVRIVAEVVQAGKRVCSLSARVVDGKMGAWLATGEHCKVEASRNKREEGGGLEKAERKRDSTLIGRAKL